MKPKIIILLLPLIMIGTHVHAASSCSRGNLTKCLDSACAINISSNPSARCQYCGTSDAGTPDTKRGMRNISVGSSTKYNISDKELKKAPTDPGERYAWATTQCLAKVTGCTPDDVSETYDELIEQSCRAAGVSAKLANTLADIAKTKTKTTCKTEIESCLISDKYCLADFRNCTENADFDKFFSTCSVNATGCDEHIASIRSELISDRDTIIANAESVLQKIVKSYADARAKKIAQIKSGCSDNTARDECVETVCSRNMNNKCATGFEFEKSIAIQLCKFYEIACATID